MRSVARWCYQRRFLVLGAWLAVLAAAFLGASSTGSNYAAGTQLSGTPSAQAAALLQRAAPSVAGDTETIVFQTKTGHRPRPGPPEPDPADAHQGLAPAVRGLHHVALPPGRRDAGQPRRHDRVR